MAIRLTCPHCGKGGHVDGRRAGKQVKCPGCGSVISVPVTAEWQGHPAQADDPVNRAAALGPSEADDPGTRRHLSEGEAPAEPFSIASPRPPRLPAMPPPIPGWFAGRRRWLTRPQFPWMANAICVYAFVIAPLILFCGLLITAHSVGDIAALYPPASRLALYLVTGLQCVKDLAVLMLLVVGARLLLNLQRSGAALVKLAIWLRYGVGLIFACVSIVASSVATRGINPERLIASWQNLSAAYTAFATLFFLFGLAASAFEVAALVWLYRHGARLPLIRD
jgi:hypothetical protein